LETRIIKLVSKSIWVALILFAIRYLIWKLNSLYDFVGAAGEVISITAVIMGLYNRFLWRYNPLEKTPKLMGEYKGVIEYSYNGTVAKKDTSVKIRQSLLSIKIQITTNEIISNTIVANIVEENEKYILYYTYITNPKCKYSKENPIQYGTCRLVLSDEDCLSGNYWTSRQTTGDLELKRVNNSK